MAELGEQAGGLGGDAGDHGVGLQPGCHQERGGGDPDPEPPAACGRARWVDRGERVSRAAAAEQGQHGGGVAHGPGEDELLDPGVRDGVDGTDQRAGGDPPAGGLEGDQPAQRGRYAQGAAAVVAVGQRNQTGGDGRGGPAARPAGGVVGVPRVAGHRVQREVGDAQLDALQRRRAAAQEGEAGVPQRGGQVGGAVRDVPAVAQQAQPAVAVRVALQLQRDVLDQDRDARERCVPRHRAGVLEGVLMRPDEHGVQLRVEQLDRLDRGLDEFGGRDTPVADQVGLGGRVQPGEVGEIHGDSPPHRSVSCRASAP